MSVEYMSREEALIDRFIPYTIGRKQDQWQETALGSHKIAMEPCSALYAYAYAVQNVQILDSTHFLTAHVGCNVIAKPRPEAQVVIDAINEVPGLAEVKTSMIRGGGPHLQGWSNKRLGRWYKNPRDLIAADRFWREPWWLEDGVVAAYNLFDKYHKRTLDNITAIINDPELAVGPKNPDTSTGLIPPVNNRGLLRDHIDEIADVWMSGCDTYYQDWKTFFLLPDGNAEPTCWPYNAGIIKVRDLYKGVDKAGRSDIKGIQWNDDNSYDIESEEREINTIIASSAHNPALNPQSWVMEVWREAGSELTVLPNDLEGTQRVMMAPPVTSSAFKDETHSEYLLNVDFGYTDEVREIRNGAFEIVKPEKVKFGADNIVFTGILTEAINGYLFASLESGRPETMVQYAIVHRGIAAACKELGLSHIRIRGVGDDLHITGTKDELIALVARLGYCFRMKGMAGDRDFILGENRYFFPDQDRVMFFNWVRWIKSIASAMQAEPIEPVYHGQNSEWIEPTPQAVAACDDFWDRWADKVVFSGNREEIRQHISPDYVRMRYEMAELGGSSPWLTDDPVI